MRESFAHISVKIISFSYWFLHTVFKLIKSFVHLMYVQLLNMNLFLFLIGFMFFGNVAKSALEKEWKHYKLEFNKKYSSNEEEQKKYKIFKANWINIEKHNKRYERGQETYLQEINRFADITDEEFTEIYGLNENDGVINFNNTTLLNRSKTIGENDYLDWKDKGAVTPAKDQGHCGSCWIFSAIAALESYTFRKTGKLNPLSEQYIVDCYSNSSCDGGDPDLALDFIKDNGVYLESDYPYNAKQNECQNSTQPLPAVFNTTAHLNSTEDDDLKQALKENGPISICLYVTYRWRFYKSGVWYNHECSEYSNHCVLLVGYGTENGNDYWLFKNSWGSKWGQKGFIKVARNKHKNYCGINTGNVYLL